jgi:hypothetical protein
VLILLAALVVLVVVAVWVMASSFLSNVPSGLGNNLGGAAGDGGDCPLMSDADARSVFGGSADAIELSGVYEMSIGFIMDKRVLANAPDCWVSDGDKAYIARIARYQGGDATAVFAAERKAAEPTSQDQGGDVTLENEGYFGGEVSGLGDEAFCTGVSTAIMAGVVVRQGDRVVYVSVGPPNENQPPQLGLESGVTTSPSLCTFAQEVARFMLR